MNFDFPGMRTFATGKHLGERIMLLREKQRLTQEQLASKIRAQVSVVINGEANTILFLGKHLKALRKYFKVEDLPILDNERASYRRRLYLWRDYMKIGSADKVKELWDELKCIEELICCDAELVLLYRMFEIRMLATKTMYDEAEEMLAQSEKYMDMFTDETLYHYHYNKGFISTCRGNYNESVKQFLDALEIYDCNDNLLPEADFGLYYNISRCYTYTDMPVMAMLYLQRVSEIHIDDRLSPMRFMVDIDTSLNYVYLNQLRDAEILLYKCYDDARFLSNKVHVGNVLCNYGLLYKKKESWEEAIGYFDQALEYFQEGSQFYYIAIYHKIHCLVLTKKTAKLVKASELLKKIQLSCEDEMWQKYFQALSHFFTIHRNITSRHLESERYIKEVAIPYFRECDSYFDILDYCQLLESHYAKSKRITKSLEITKEILAVVQRCYCNHIGGVL